MKLKLNLFPVVPDMEEKIAAILQEAGYKVGTFTSPHLHSYSERFRINGMEITQKRVAGLVGEIRPYLEAMAADGFEPPTEFEVSTALAFLYFSREKVDYLLLEVGLGGAIDSTNVAPSMLSVITNVAMDHMNYLGNTIYEIARAKAGIIKPGCPVVTAAAGEGLQVIEEVCRQKDSRLTIVGSDVTWKGKTMSLKGQCFSVQGKKGSYENLFLSLLGRHQLINAATTIAAAEILIESGAVISNEAIRKGLAAAQWPGRFEIIRENPLVIIDGAHNYEGSRSLRLALDDYFPNRSLILMIGMLMDKERESVAAELVPRARAVVVTRPNSPRAGNWQGMAMEAERYIPEVYLEEDIRKAVHKAIALAGLGEIVCITGSLYMVAEAREILLDLR